MTTPPDTFAPTSSDTAPSSARRVLGLARANATLVLRNRLTLLYGLVVPVAPIALLFAQDRDDPNYGAGALIFVAILALLFPVYYNLLSAVVTRRDELVLKRLRSGETRDREILASLAVPGAVIAVAATALGAVATLALGVSLPVNAALFLLTMIAGIVMASALALWTAAWTRNAEAAQLTSAPVMLLLVLGQTAITYPSAVREFMVWTPGTAITSLVRTSWFGLDPVTTGEISQEATLDFMSSWGPSAQPMLVLAGWTVLALVLAARSMRWEPRS